MDDPLFGDDNPLFDDIEETKSAAAVEDAPKTEEENTPGDLSSPSDTIVDATAKEVKAETEQPEENINSEEDLEETAKESSNPEIKEAFETAEAAVQEAIPDSPPIEDEKTIEGAADSNTDIEETSEQKNTETEEKPKNEMSDEEYMAKKRARKKYSRFQQYREGENAAEEFTWAGFLKKNFLYIIFCLMGLLITAAFGVQIIDIRQHENIKKLRGHVLLHHEIPEWHKGKIPKEIDLLLKEHHKQEEQKKNHSVEIDIHKDMPIMGEYYPQTLNNEDLLLILEYQNIGKVSRAGVEDTKLMNLSGLDLRKVNFYYLKNFLQSNLKQVDMSGVKNQDAVFRAASLDAALFIEADLDNSKFIRAKLPEADFSYAMLNNTDFRSARGLKAKFEYAQITRSQFRKASFKESNFNRANLAHSDLMYSNFQGSSFIGANLEATSFRKADLSSVDFSNANLRYADFTEAKLDGANLDGADIEGAKFTHASIFQTRLGGTKNYTREQLDSSDFILGAKSLPKDLYPKKTDWTKRF